MISGSNYFVFIVLITSEKTLLQRKKPRHMPFLRDKERLMAKCNLSMKTILPPVSSGYKFSKFKIAFHSIVWCQNISTII